MNFLGIHLTLLIGPTVPVPAPPTVMEALAGVEVTHSDQEPSGFQLTFQVGRSGPLDLLDYGLVSNPLLRPGNRVVLIVSFNAAPRVLMDGIVSHQQLAPSDAPGASTLTLTGEDVSLMMDREEKAVEHPALDETLIALRIIAGYVQYGLIPLVLPPPVIDPPLPIERVPAQTATDLEYLQDLAARHGYVFYVAPGPAPLTNTAYWGPPRRLDLPQSALSVNMGPASNVTHISFRNNALAATRVAGQVQDRLTNQSLPVQTFASLRPPLATQPAWLVHAAAGRTRRFRGSGLNFMQAMSRAQGMMEESVDVVTAEGELDALNFGGLLQARGLVGLRGAGYSYDGLWYVKRVTHNLKKGEYTQRFTLTREGVGATVPLVMP